MCWESWQYMPRMWINLFHVIALQESHKTLFLKHETLICVQNTLFEKYTRFHGAFAPNSEVCFEQEFLNVNFRTVGYYQNMLFSSQTDTS